MQSRRRQAMYNYKHQLTRNKYDDAFVMGYHNGYHAVKYDNQYDKDAQAQYWIKFKHGYTAGKLMRVKEERKAI
tara:strand:- start:102 stop:323 length:222 start_codon:yes stop_codon:yes gene_type:complete